MLVVYCFCKAAIYTEAALSFLPRAAMRITVYYILAVGRSLSVRLSVISVYCIHTAKDTVKLLSRPDSAIMLVLFSPNAFIQFQGKLLQRGVKYTGVGEICDFRQKSPFISRKRYDVGPWLLWNVNSSHKSPIDPCRFR